MITNMTVSVPIRKANWPMYCLLGSFPNALQVRISSVLFFSNVFEIKRHFFTYATHQRAVVYIKFVIFCTLTLASYFTKLLLQIIQIHKIGSVIYSKVQDLVLF